MDTKTYLEYQKLNLWWQNELNDFQRVELMDRSVWDVSEFKKFAQLKELKKRYEKMLSESGI